MRNRIEKEKIPNVRLYNYGLSDKDGQGILRISSSNTNSMYLLTERFGRISWPQTKMEEKIELRSLDSFCVENKINEASLLYLNVESHELSVSHGAVNLLKNTCAIFIEMNMLPIWDGPTFNVVNKFLVENNFHLAMHVQRPFLPATKAQIFALYMHNSTFPK